MFIFKNFKKRIVNKSAITFAVLGIIVTQSPIIAGERITVNKVVEIPLSEKFKGDGKLNAKAVLAAMTVHAQTVYGAGNVKVSGKSTTFDVAHDVTAVPMFAPVDATLAGKIVATGSAQVVQVVKAKFNSFPGDLCKEGDGKFIIDIGKETLTVQFEGGGDKVSDSFLAGKAPAFVAKKSLEGVTNALTAMFGGK